MKPASKRSPLGTFLWIGALSLTWPLVHLLVARFRFGANFVGGFADALVFLPMGALSGGLLVYLLDIAESRQQQSLSVLGYVAASPMAFIGSLGGGLFLPPVIGATLFGGIPLAVGALVGYYAGKLFTPKKD